MELPRVETVRNRISNYPEEDAKFCLMAAYLFAARISEVVGYAYPSDETTTPRGPRGTDVALETYLDRDRQVEAVVFTVHTAKRKGMDRFVGLPANPEYEPWAKPLYEYFQSKGDMKVFPFTRQEMWMHSAKAFEGLRYKVMGYKIWNQNEADPEYIPDHSRAFRLHALRHLRASELVKIYGFDGVDLAAYGGWTLAQAARMQSTIFDRYVALSWQKYFPKLLRKNRWKRGRFYGV